MSIINPGYTPTPDGIKVAKQIILNRVFNSNALRGIEVFKDIQFGQRFGLTDGFGVIGKAFNGCKPEELGDLALTDKVANPRLMGARIKYCRANQNQLFRLVNKSKSRFADWFKANENADEDFKTFVAVIMESVAESIPAKIWFSDLAADTFANGGVFTNGTDLGLFNQIDGIWKQIFGEASIPKVSITKNTGASYAAQQLTPTEAYTIVKDLYNNAPLSLMGDEEKEIKVTRSIYRGLLTYISENAKGCECVKELRDGKQVVFFIDTPVYPEDSWDGIIQKHQNNGTKYNLPHRAIFSTPSNTIALTPSKTEIAQLDKFYSQVEKANFIDVGWWLDAMLVNPAKIAVAY